MVPSGQVQRQLICDADFVNTNLHPASHPVPRSYWLLSSIPHLHALLFFLTTPLEPEPCNLAIGHDCPEAVVPPNTRLLSAQSAER